MAYAKSHDSTSCDWGPWSCISELKKYMKQIGVKVSENRTTGDSKDTKKGTVPVIRRKRETWDP